MLHVEAPNGGPHRKAPGPAIGRPLAVGRPHFIDEEEEEVDAGAQADASVMSHVVVRKKPAPVKGAAAYKASERSKSYNAHDDSSFVIDDDEDDDDDATVDGSSLSDDEAELDDDDDSDVEVLEPGQWQSHASQMPSRPAASTSKKKKSHLATAQEDLLDELLKYVQQVGQMSFQASGCHCILG